ncbi:PREDICTED: YTH domain-containing family protein 1-like [Lupinus angustifolius]|uniref:YTH domain-containing family protein 1-like n=1 Tax=Lupinus angustifolius TaxID=3871 RepID=UPI00092F3F88|nr:PREDICTED: YTH domain-containing family protein 1-like [Lupinus angustifolius]
MSTIASAADQTTDLLQNLTLDNKPKSLEIPEPTKKISGNQHGTVDSGNALNGQIPPYDRSLTPLLQDFMDPAMYYFPSGYPSPAYYYSGYDGTGNEWEDYSRFMNPEGVDMTSGLYGDNGSMLYHHGYGYAPYAPYSPAGSPIPTMGNDGQLYGPQHYQYPQYFQPLTPTSGGSFAPTATVPPQREIATSVAAADKKSLPVETANGNSNGVANGGNTKGRGPTSGYQDPRFVFDGARSPVHWVDAPLFSDAQQKPASSSSITSSVPGGNNSTASRNQTFRPNSQFMGLQHPRPIPALGANPGFINRMYPNKLYGQYGNTIRSGIGYGAQGYDSRTNGRAWLAVDNKYKTRGRSGGYFGYGNDNMDGLNELNRGPRAKGNKNLKGFTPTILAVKGQNLPATLSIGEDKDKTISAPDLDQYNKAEFPEEYADAKFFIIKSYSEDDIHKSIKYNVWASTQNGNKKLDAAYQDAQQKPGGCPVFLFFSVNTSGQFVGVAEMIGSVDFNKSLEYWQQDKWNGCFPLKWHIVKDVPNNLLRHISLENNENKPVTNSRDTQEVLLEPGLKLIKIFKEYTSKTCILDDFGFYESRQKTILEKKVKQQNPKQVWEGKSTDEKTEINGELKAQNLGVASELLKDLIPAKKDTDDHKLSENGSVAKAIDAPKGAKPVVSETKIAANGTANGY